MNSSTEEKLKEVLSKVFLLEKSEINGDLSRKDVDAWDSLTHLMLISEVESAFNVMFSDDDIIGINTVSDLKKTLKKLGVNI